jgi:uncharacterized membrane protein
MDLTEIIIRLGLTVGIDLLSAYLTWRFLKWRDSRRERTDDEPETPSAGPYR